MLSLILVLIFTVILVSHFPMIFRDIFYIKNNFNAVVLAYFLFGSSIVALLFNVFLVGPFIGFALISLCLLNIEKLTNELLQSTIKLKLFISFLFILLMALLAYSILSTEIYYAAEKIVFYFFSILVCLYAVMYLNSREQLDKFIQYSHLFLTIYFLLVVINIDLANSMYSLTNNYDSGENRIVLSRFLFIYILLSLYLSKGNRVMLFAILSAVSLYLFAAARGPLLALILSLVTYLLFNYKKVMTGKVFYLFMIMLSSCIFITVTYFDMDELFENIIILDRLFNTENIEASSRGKLFFAIFEHFQALEFKEIFLGYGVGDSILHIGHKYPHNILIELFFEMGVLGLLLSCVMVYFNLIVYKTRTTDRLYFTLLIIQGMLFYSALFSGSVHSLTLNLLFLTIIINYERSIVK